MFCFYTYRRTLQILKEREDSLQRPYRGIQLTDTEVIRPFEVDMIEKDYYLKTKFSNSTLSILFHIITHLYTAYYYLSLPEDTNVLFVEKYISDFFLDCYLDSKYEAFDAMDNDFEGDDFRDIFEKYHYLNFPENPESVQSFFESLNNRELIRVMKLVSWLISPGEHITIHNEGTYPQDDLTKIFTIDRMIEMNDAIIGYFEETHHEVSIQKQRLLNAHLGYYIKYKMEDRILSIIEYYSNDILELSESNLEGIFYHSLNGVIYKLVSKRIISIYNIEKISKFDGINRLYLALIEELPKNDEDENKKRVENMITNLRFILMLRGGREDHELIQFIDNNSVIKYKIPKNYICKLAEKPLVLMHMLENGLISKRRILYEILIELMDNFDFSKILSYIPIQVLCDFDFDKYTSLNKIDDETIYTYTGSKDSGILFGCEFKRRTRQKYILSIIPSNSPIYIKSLIYDYLIKH